MATKNTVLSKKYSDFAGGSVVNHGGFKTYMNSPQVLVYGEYNGWDRDFENYILKLNGVQYFNSGQGFNSKYVMFTLEGDTYGGTAKGPNSEATAYKINPIFTHNSKLGAREVVSNTIGIVDREGPFTSYLEVWDNTWIFGADPESWGCTTNFYYCDNTFNRKYSGVKLTNDTTTFYMSTSKVNGFTNDLPNLVKINKDTIDTNTDDLIIYNKDTNSYAFPWKNDTERVYRFETPGWEKYDASASGFLSNDEVRVTIPSIVLMNDEIHILNKTLEKLNSSNLTRKDNVLSWRKIPNASMYYIWRDGVLVHETTDTSYTIPEEYYYDEKHSYSITVGSVKRNEYYGRELTGNVAGGAAGECYAKRETYLTIYKGNDSKITSDSWTDVGYINHPTVTVTKLKQNCYQFSLSHNCNADVVKLYYSIGKNGTKEQIFNGVKVFDKLKVNTTYDFYFWVGATNDGRETFSDGYNYPITPTKYPAPVITDITKTSFNSYRINFSSSGKPDRYAVYLNGKIISGNASNSISIPGWRALSENIIKIEAIFDEDNSYNNALTKTYGAEKTPLLLTPVLTKTDLYEDNVKLNFGSESSVENNVVTKVKLSWTASEYASGYVLYDEYTYYDNDMQAYETGVNVIPPQVEGGPTEVSTSTEYIVEMNNVIGDHKYTVVAIATADESYNSKVSNEIILKQNYELKAPIVEYDPATTTISFNKVENADFYSVQLVPTNGTTHTLFSSYNIPSDQDRLTLNYYDMLKDLKESEQFTISVFARSYNAFYFHPSENSNISTVDVIKLPTPVNLQYNVGEETVVSWTGDDRTYKYEFYIKALDGFWTKHILDDTRFISNLSPSFYVCYVKATRDESRTNHQPVYLNSENSVNLPFGQINTPSNFQRHVNKFSWDSVGADRYVFYEVKEDEEGNEYYDSITTIDGGGTSLELGMLSDK